MRVALAAIFAGVLSGLAITAHAQSAMTQESHGSYLVNRAALCTDCHTPRDQHGQLIQSKALQGADIDSKPTHPMPWATHAPRIAGIPDGFTKQQFIAFMESGKRPDGSSPLPPMPGYRLNEADATALVGYIAAMPKQ